MLLFTFYLYRPDGSSIAFESFELIDDARAMVQARKVLFEHPSAVQVEIWSGERQVGVVEQLPPGPMSLGSRADNCPTGPALSG
jgi:hypothetical protein